MRQLLLGMKFSFSYVSFLHICKIFVFIRPACFYALLFVPVFVCECMYVRVWVWMYVSVCFIFYIEKRFI